ncbi:serine/threonine protein kinase [Histoplasma capsulatum]|uniref:Serine/threonine protein kinase n=1 Tax=Ajellomyces capsulatus TaxID=5037 RepID=A0A8A1MK25_AJECA|nr:serine/threonine protein kinase [Histoplasma capsulatum]
MVGANRSRVANKQEPFFLRRSAKSLLGMSHLGLVSIYLPRFRGATATPTLNDDAELGRTKAQFQHVSELIITPNHPKRQTMSLLSAQPSNSLAVRLSCT